EHAAAAAPGAPIPRVEAEEGRVAAGRPPKAKHQADRRGLARAVRAEESHQLPRAYGEIDPLQRLDRAKPLARARELDHRRHRARLSTRSAPGSKADSGTSRSGFQGNTPPPGRAFLLIRCGHEPQTVSTLRSRGAP